MNLQIKLIGKRKKKNLSSVVRTQHIIYTRMIKEKLFYQSDWNKYGDGEWGQEDIGGV